MTSELLQIKGLEILEKLGGGMASVYKARQTLLDRIVVVKVLPQTAISNEEARSRFETEARLTSTLEHPNIVKTIASGITENGLPYLVLEYIEGPTLAHELQQNGPLNLRRFREIFIPVLSGLAAAHEAGMVHRDIKPGNIMICTASASGQSELTAKLVDFGIAKIGSNENSPGVTKTGQVVGTPKYMSPEQCLGKALDARSDLYSMACVMFESLTGAPPFESESLMETMQKHIRENPPTVSDLSRKLHIRKELAAVVLSGLEKQPENRPASASILSKELSAVLDTMTLDKIPMKSLSVRVCGQLPRYAGLFFAAMLMLLFCCLLPAALRKQQGKNQNSPVEGRKKVKLTRFNRGGISFLYPKNWLDEYGEGAEIGRLRLPYLQVGRGATIEIKRYAREAEEEYRTCLEDSLKNHKVLQSGPFQISPSLSGYQVLAEFKDTRGNDINLVMKGAIQQGLHPVEQELVTKNKWDVVFGNRGSAYLFSFISSPERKADEKEEFMRLLKTIEFTDTHSRTRS